jgi:hypothetical protein
METFVFALHEKVTHKDELYIIAGRAEYISNQVMYLLQPFEIYEERDLDFTTCKWEKAINIIRYEKSKKITKRKRKRNRKI